MQSEYRTEKPNRERERERLGRVSGIIVEKTTGRDWSLLVVHFPWNFMTKLLKYAAACSQSAGWLTAAQGFVEVSCLLTTYTSLKHLGLLTHANNTI